MRVKERIPIFLDLIKPKLTKYLREIVELDNVTANQWYSYIEQNWSKIEDFWITNQDLRFSQVLQEFGLYKDSFWYYEEEDQVLKKLNIPLSEYAIWGTRCKDGKSPLKYKLLKDLKSDHLQAILKTQKNISELYKTLIVSTLNDRNERVSNED